MILTHEKVSAILNEIEGSENQKRKSEAYRSYKAYEGELRVYVQAEIERIFPETGKNYQISDYSVLKKIVDKKSKAYKEPPLRSLDNTNETSLYNDLLSEFDFNGAMSEFDKYYNQHKYCLMGVMYERIPDEYGSIVDNWKFLPLEPYDYDIILGEGGKLEAVILSYPDQLIVSGAQSDGVNQIIADSVNDKGEIKTYAVWTKTQMLIYVGKKRNGKWKYEFQPTMDNPNGVNPYGVLPFVYAPKANSKEYPVASPLFFQTVEMNKELSMYYTSGIMQLGQLVVEYPSSQNMETVSSGLFVALKLPQSEIPGAPGTKASYISPSPNMAGHKESIITHITCILDEQNINSTSVIKPDESFPSGFDRLLASADVQDLIEQNQNLYRWVEKQVFKIIKAIHRNFIGRDLFKSNKINVVYKKPRILVTDTEKLNNIKLKNELGLYLPWEKFMDLDPNLSEDEAKLKYENIEKLKLERVKLLMPEESQEDAEESEE